MKEHILKAALAGLLHNTDGGELTALADILSAGEWVDQSGNAVPPHQQLVSIFDSISLNGKPSLKDFHYLPLKRLTLDKEVIFPDAAQPEKSREDAYKALLQELEQVTQVPGDDETYLENLLSVMQRTMWCVPSTDAPDVSRYDQSRMTAALAVCLAERSSDDIGAISGAVTRAFGEEPKKDGDQALLDEPVALLVGGDISGVQKFIYTLSSKQAAKTLRGRSFYLQLLTEAVLRYALRELGLPYTNVIYSGGGHFFILAPLSAEEKLPEIKAEISRKLLRHHGVSLYLALGKAEISVHNLQKGNFPTAWHRMHRDLNRAKKQKYTELGADFHKEVFALKEHGGNQDETCAVCGQESKHISEIKDSVEKQDEKKTRICALCKSFAEDIGKNLPKSDFVGLGLTEPKESERKAAFTALREFGVLVKLATAKDEIKFEAKVERTVVWALDDAEKFPAVKGAPAAHTTRYTVNLIPMGTDTAPLAFDELQKERPGIERLGVLRMDVDDLGDIIQDGLGKSASLARIATLSFQTTLFFEGWLKKICEQKKYENLIYAVYTGGDDLFLIGPWDLMPDLAQQIARDLKTYTGGNPDIHISGGMAFIGGKYPVYQAADDAEEALDMAKDRKDENNEVIKNAFAFLDYAWGWDEFAEISENFELIRLINDEGGPKAIMQTLRELTVQKADSLSKNETLEYGPWIWQGMYNIHRMIERADKKKQESVVKNLAKIQKSLGDENYQNLEKWGTAARWAQVYTRDSERE